MKNFVTGLVIGLPVGMLLSDIVRPGRRSEMAERMREIWIDARARAEQLKSAGEIARTEGRDAVNRGEIVSESASGSFAHARGL
jgi:hypothetical protein